MLFNCLIIKLSKTGHLKLSIEIIMINILDYENKRLISYNHSKYFNNISKVIVNVINNLK